MSSLSFRKHRGQFKVTWNDVEVVVAALLVITHDAWSRLVEWTPHIFQGVILTATVIYVAARAAIEVRKFMLGDKHHDS